MTKMIVEPVPAACGAHASHWAAGDLRTLRRYFWDFVLPVLTLAAMSAMTAAVLVLLVSAVADIGLYSQSRQASPDPWSAAGFGPAYQRDVQTYPEYPARMDMSNGEEASSVEPELGPQTNDQVDVPWARWVPE